MKSTKKPHDARQKTNADKEQVQQRTPPRSPGREPGPSEKGGRQAGGPGAGKK